MLGEQEIAEEERAGGLVEDGEVVVGVRGLLRLQANLAVAQIELELVVDAQRRGNDARAGEGLLAQQLLVDRKVARCAGGERARQLVMADKDRFLGRERGVSEHVVGVHVRVDDVLYGQLRAGADGCEQRLADARAAAGVDDGDPIAADDEAGVGGVARIARREDLVAPLVNENAGNDLVDVEGFSSVRRAHARKKCRQKQGPQAAETGRFCGQEHDR